MQQRYALPGLPSCRGAVLTQSLQARAHSWFLSLCPKSWACAAEARVPTEARRSSTACFCCSFLPPSTASSRVSIAWLTLASSSMLSSVTVAHLTRLHCTQQGYVSRLQGHVVLWKAWLNALLARCGYTINAIRGNRFKLCEKIRALGIPLSKPAFVHYVVTNTKSHKGWLQTSNLQQKMPLTTEHE